MKNGPRKTDWIRCCRRKNCPSVAVDGERVWVRDDGGNIIHITAEQLTDVMHTVKLLLSGKHDLAPDSKAK